jgi:hypothetical protein
VAFPVTSLVDNFNRADGAAGANWTVIGGASFETLQIATNQVASDGVLKEWARWNPSTFGPDSECYVTKTNSGAFALELMVGVRINGTDATPNGYFLRVSGSTWQIFRCTGGTLTALSGTVSQALNTGDSIGIEVIGTVLKAYYKASGGSWVNKLTYDTTSDATKYTAAGYIGMRVDDGGVSTVDNFSGGSISSAATLTGAAAFTAASHFTVAGVRVKVGAAAFSAASSMTETGIVIRPAAAAFHAASSMTAAGLGIHPAAAAFNAASSMTVAGVRVKLGAAAFSAASSMSPTGLVIRPASAAFTAHASGTAVGVAIRKASAAFTASATMTASAVATYNDAAHFTAASSMTVSGGSVLSGAAAFTAASSMTVGGVDEKLDSAAFTAASSMVVAAIAKYPDSTHFTAAASMVAAALCVRPGAAAFAASSSASVAGVVIRPESAAFTAHASGTAVGVAILQDSAAFHASASMTATAREIRVDSAHLVAVATMGVTGRSHYTRAIAPMYRIRVDWGGSQNVFIVGYSLVDGPAVVAGAAVDITDATFLNAHADVTSRALKGRIQRKVASDRIVDGRLDLTLSDPWPGDYNPLNAASEVDGLMVPMIRCDVDVSFDDGATWEGLFMGWLDETQGDQDYGTGTATLSFVDMPNGFFDNLVPAIASTGPIHAGDAIGLVHAGIGITDETLWDFAPGVVLADFSTDGTQTARQVIADILAVDLGVYYQARDGKRTYADRFEFMRRASAGTFQSARSSAPGVSRSGLVNGASATYDGTTETYQDGVSRRLYGPHDDSSTPDSPWFGSTAAALANAKWRVKSGKDPVSADWDFAPVTDHLLELEEIVLADIQDVLDAGPIGLPTVRYVASWITHEFAAGEAHKTSWRLRRPPALGAFTVGSSLVDGPDVVVTEVA